MKFIVAFSSPAGSTAKIGDAVKETLEELNKEVFVINLDKKRTGLEKVERYIDGEPFCIFIGTPVYRDVTVPSVLALVKSIRPIGDSYAVPFCTWGGAASGIALYQMTKILQANGFIVPAAAKVIAPHSMMRYTKEPLGKDHPDDDDKKAVQRMTRYVVEAVVAGSRKGLDLAVLDYPNPEYAADMKKKLDLPLDITPKKVDENACTYCGLCAGECPADAIDISSNERFSDTCFDCCNCFFICPENAIKIPISLEQLDQRIRNRSKTMNEAPVTTIFYPD